MLSIACPPGNPRKLPCSERGMAGREVGGERVDAVGEEEGKEVYRQEALAAAGGRCLTWPPSWPLLLAMG